MIKLLAIISVFTLIGCVVEPAGYYNGGVYVSPGYSQPYPYNYYGHGYYRHY